MKSGIALFVVLAWLPLAAVAQPQVGEKLSLLHVDDCGEMRLAGADVTYRPWQSQGHPVLVHFLAARAGVAELNATVLRQLIRARPGLLPLTITLVNAQDAVWGTSALVKGWTEHRKRGLPHARMVLDCEGRMASEWSLPAETSVLLLLDAENTVRFIHVGATPEERVTELLAEVDALGLPNVSAGPDSAARESTR